MLVDSARGGGGAEEQDKWIPEATIQQVYMKSINFILSKTQSQWEQNNRGGYLIAPPLSLSEVEHRFGMPEALGLVLSITLLKNKNAIKTKLHINLQWKLFF